MLRALDGIDLLDVVARELVRRASGAERPRTGDHAGVVVSTNTTAVEDPDTGRVCLLPTPSLHMISLAALATLAARELLTPAVVTVAVFGTGPAARLHLSLIARYIPNVSHAAVHPAALEIDRSAEWSVRDELERAGTTLSISADPRQAALGANLLVIAELGWGRLEIGNLHPGVVIINATRRDLPDELLAEVDRVYVDDIGLLEHNQHRKFVRLHQAGSDKRPDPTHRPREGWHRRLAPWRYQRRIDTDLGQVLTGGRTHADIDDVILVELLNGGSLGVWLAGRIYRAAIALGLDL
jgi:ornithine cyclodeaminase/alanine dehydrogenase-like protein (mu-crystallin family)